MFHRSEKARAEEYFLFVFTGKGIWSKIEFEVWRIFDGLWRIKIANVYVIATTDNKDDVIAKIYTFSPYNERCSNEVEVVVDNEYRKDRFASELNVFVDKFRDMHQCPLTVVTMSDSIVFTVTLADGRMSLGGLEGNIISYLAQAMNFKINLKIIPNRNNRLHESMAEMV